VADFDRITRDALVMGGRACIRGMRVTVAMILRHMSADVSIEEILADYPYLEREDIVQALHYAASRLQSRGLGPFRPRAIANDRDAAN